MYAVVLLFCKRGLHFLPMLKCASSVWSWLVIKTGSPTLTGVFSSASKQLLPVCAVLFDFKMGFDVSGMIITGFSAQCMHACVMEVQGLTVMQALITGSGMFAACGGNNLSNLFLSNLSGTGLLARCSKQDVASVSKHAVLLKATLHSCHKEGVNSRLPTWQWCLPRDDAAM